MFGLELSSDIFQINLDRHYAQDDEGRISFFEDLIFRHLCFCNNNLKDFESESDLSEYNTPRGRPLSSFFEYIFKTKEVLKLLIHASGALPRDFLQLFDILAKNKNFSIATPWTVKDVVEATIAHFVTNKHSLIEKDEIAQKLYSKIIDRVTKNGDRLIVVPNSSPQETLMGFESLYHNRFIHDVSLFQIPSKHRNNYTFYYADLGLEIDANKKKKEKALIAENPSSIYHLEIDFDNINLDDFVIAGSDD